MTVPVRPDRAAYAPVRMDDGERVRARLIRWPDLPDGSRVVFSAANRLYVMAFRRRRVADAGAATRRRDLGPSS
jgi:hypothetical protein